MECQALMGQLSASANSLSTLDCAITEEIQLEYVSEPDKDEGH